jgi:hypothetical protein
LAVLGEVIKSTAVTVQLVEKETNAGKGATPTRGEQTYTGTPEMVAEELQAMVEAGIDFTVVTPGPIEAHRQCPSPAISRARRVAASRW